MIQGPMLLVVFIVVIGLMVMMMRRFRVQAFISLLLAAFVAGLAAGMDPVQVSWIVAKGFGGTAEKIGIMIVAGAIIGVALERSGAAYVIAETVLKVAGEKRPALALSAMGFLVSVFICCDAGFIILATLTKSLAKRTGMAMTTMTAALSTGLYATYILVPPTPGPVAAANILRAELGAVIAMGLCAAVPAAAAGYFWATRYAGRFDHATKAAVSYEEIIAIYPKLPGVLSSFAPVILPLLLIALKSAGNCSGLPFGQGCFKTLMDFAGEPMVALLLGVGACLCLVSELKPEGLSDWINQGIKGAAPIVLVTSAGGALGVMLTAIGIGNYLGVTLLQYNIGILLPFVMAAGLKTVQGSSLAALITTSTVIFPSLSALGLGSPMGAVLSTLAIGAGAMTVSHVNDTYFWVVAQFSGLDESTVIKTHTMATFIMGLTAMATIWVLACLLL
jgi:GntP family gluconate:H+ symporter